MTEENGKVVPMGRESRSNPFSNAPRPPEAVGAALDGLGRPLQEGDGVFLALRAPGLYRVLGVTPVLDPTQPPGQLHVHVAHFETLTVERGRPVPAVMRVGTAVECPPMPIQLQGVEEAPSVPETERS